MGTPTKSRAAQTFAAIAAALTVTGCAQAGNAGLALAGVKSRGPAPTVPATPSVRTDAPAATTSIYEHTPSLPWSVRAQGTPYHPHHTLYDRLGWNSCTVQPAGVSRVLPVADGPDALSLASLGPFEVGAAGLPVLETRTLFREGAGDLAWRMIERTSRNATVDAGCGYRVFFYLGLAGSSGSQPVIVSR